MMQLTGKFGKPVEIFVQVQPPSVVANTLLFAEYPENVTNTLLASVLSTTILVICATPVGKLDEIVDQLVPPFTVLYKPLADAA